MEANPVKVTPLCFGKRVSAPFRARLLQMAERLQVNPDYPMAAMAFETGETFSASIRNAAGSGAVGLIQFMPATAQVLGTTTEALAAMDPVKQLDYVERYFRPSAGRLQTLEDVYMAILWPAAVGKPDTYVLFDRADPKHPKRYRQNAGLDFNRDGRITKAEAAKRVRMKFIKGLWAENAED